MEKIDYFLQANEMLRKGNGKQAVNLFSKELKKNPTNPYIKMTYAKLLLCNNDTIDRGFKLANRVANSEYRSLALLTLGRYYRLIGDLEQAKKCLFELKEFDSVNNLAAVKDIIYLDILEQKYTDAYNLLEKYYDEISGTKVDNDLDNIKFYLKYKLKLIKIDDLNNINNFFCRMLVSYNKDSIIKYITKNNNCYRNSMFNDDVNIAALFDRSKNLVHNVNPVFSTLMDHYIINCGDTIGTVNYRNTETIKIVTYINTKNILNIYPTSNDFIYSQNFGFGSSEKIKKLV